MRPLHLSRPISTFLAAILLASVPLMSFGIVGNDSCRFSDAKDLGCPKKSDCSSCTGGMPEWRITEPYQSLWISDEPLSYMTSSGQKMSFQWNYRQRPGLSGERSEERRVG